jgi:hypothetical protein
MRLLTPGTTRPAHIFLPTRTVATTENKIEIAEFIGLLQRTLKNV